MSGSDSDALQELFRRLLGVKASQSSTPPSSTNAGAQINSSSTNPNAGAVGSSGVPLETPRVGLARTPEVTPEVDDFLQNTIATLQAKTDDLNRSASGLRQSEKRINSRLLDATAKLDEVDARLQGADKLLDQLNDSQKKLVDEVQLIRGNAVSALSIFVSFFAFITVSINVFSKAGSLTVGAVLVLLFWSMLVGFNVLIGWQFNTIKNNAMALVVLAFVAALSVFSLVLMYHWAPDTVTATKTILEPPK